RTLTGSARSSSPGVAAYRRPESVPCLRTSGRYRRSSRTCNLRVHVKPAYLAHWRNGAHSSSLATPEPCSPLSRARLVLPSSAEQRQASRGTQCSRPDDPSGQRALGGHVQGWPFHEKPRRCPPLVVRLHTGPLRCGHRASSPGGPTDSVAAALVRTTMNPLHLCTQCAQHCGQVHLDNR